MEKAIQMARMSKAIIFEHYAVSSRDMKES